MTFQSSGHFGNDEVIHLLSGLWMISVAGTYGGYKGKLLLTVFSDVQKAVSPDEALVPEVE